MKFKLTLLIISFFVSLVSFCQRIIISGEETSRKLQWSDFTGSIDKTSPFFAHTFWRLNYHYNEVQFKADTAIINGFEVKLELAPEESWVKKIKKLTNCWFMNKDISTLEFYVCMKSWLLIKKLILCAATFEVKCRICLIQL